MTYLNAKTLEHISYGEFQNKKPFPWTNIQDFLTQEAFDELFATLPNPSQLDNEFGKTRGYGQQSHDRLSLQYRPGLNLSQAWHEFISVLQGDQYKQFIRQMYGLKENEPVVLTMHWHYAKSGCSVSPHVDARRKLGSHIFYFHKDDEWDENWGGQTVVLKGKKDINPHSAPGFDDFIDVAQSKITNNSSFMFHRTDDSWHGVKPLLCPEDRLRKVFIVVINRLTFQVRWRAMRGKDADGYRLVRN